jgi:hypothetical protein
MNESEHERVPAHTTPTWEMELLVSGATIFGLLQLPTLLDHGYFRFYNLLPGAYARLVMPLWLYSKIAVVTLVLTFITHLCLRGYWVALVGMNSVYPGGIRWDRLGLGPIARERFRAHGDDMPSVIERADNRATRVFGIGFSFAMMMLVPLVLALVAVATSVALSAAFGGEYTASVLMAIVLIVVVPWMVVAVADRRFAAQIARSPGLARVLGAVTGLYGRMGLSPRSNPLAALISSHAGRMRFGLLAALVLLPMAMLIGVQASTKRGQLPFGLNFGLSTGDPFSTTTSPNAYYADERGDGFAVTPLPHIRSRVVEGPYLEVFVPFITRLHGTALPLACPGLGDPDRDGRLRLGCLARMIALQVDGVPVAVPLDASTDASTGQPGMLAMIPVGALAPGRHELSLNELDSRERGAKPRRYRIAFWK